MKNRQWSLLFIPIFLIGCGGSSTQTDADDKTNANDKIVDSKSPVKRNNTDETQTPIANEKEYKVVLKSTKKIAGYEIHLKFNKSVPLEETLALNSDFLASTGRTVSSLGPEVNSKTKELKFGTFSFGDNDGVSGKFTTLSFKLMEDNISILKQICVDRNANNIECDVQIQKN